MHRQLLVGREHKRDISSHRDEGLDILILARTDARQADSLEEALARISAFAEAGRVEGFDVRLHPTDIAPGAEQPTSLGLGISCSLSYVAGPCIHAIALLHSYGDLQVPTFFSCRNVVVGTRLPKSGDGRLRF